MEIIYEVRKYDSPESMKRALSQFKRYNYPEVLCTREGDREYVVKVTKHHYPFVTAVLRRLKRMERVRAEMVNSRINEVLTNIARRVA